jgi:hypothetical protein
MEGWGGLCCGLLEVLGRDEVASSDAEEIKGVVEENLWRRSVRSVPGDNAPLSVAPHIDLGEAPVFVDLFTHEGTLPDQSTGNDCGLAEGANGNIGCFVLLELHLTRAPDGQRLGFVEDRHLWDGDDQFIGPECVKCGCIASHVGIVPNGFEALEFVLCCGVWSGLCFCLGCQQGR